MKPVVQAIAGRSMRQRVLRATVLSAAAGSIFAAAIAIVAVDALIAGHSDKRLQSAADVLAGEIDEMRTEAEHESLDEVLKDENGEIVTSGIRLAVYEDGELIAGDAWAKVARSGQCQTIAGAEHRQRVCGRGYDRWTLVAAQFTDDDALHWRFALAGLGALALGIIMATLLGRRLASWSVAPLSKLSQQLHDLDPQDLVALRPVDSEECAEVLSVQNAVEQLVARVQSLLEQSQRFAADAAHELRTPLTKLSAHLDLMLEDRDRETRAGIEAAWQQTRALTDLIDRLLLLASPAGEFSVGFEPVALDDVIADVRDSLSTSDRERVQWQSESEGLVRGDAILLRSLVANALSNALKFSDPRPVLLQLDETTEGVVVRIRDEGPGIPAELQKRVFEPFYRRRADATPGHGLGLAIIGHIVSAHEGTAAFEAAEKGTVLCIRLPHWRPS